METSQKDNIDNMNKDNKPDIKRTNTNNEHKAQFKGTNQKHINSNSGQRVMKADVVNSTLRDGNENRRQMNEFPSQDNKSEGRPGTVAVPSGGKAKVGFLREDLREGDRSINRVSGPYENVLNNINNTQVRE